VGTGAATSTWRACWSSWCRSLSPACPLGTTVSAWREWLVKTRPFRPNFLKERDGWSCNSELASSIQGGSSFQRYSFNNCLWKTALKKTRAGLAASHSFETNSGWVMEALFQNYDCRRCQPASRICSRASLSNEVIPHVIYWSFSAIIDLLSMDWTLKNLNWLSLSQFDLHQRFLFLCLFSFPTHWASEVSSPWFPLPAASWQQASLLLCW